MSSEPDAQIAEAESLLTRLGEIVLGAIRDAKYWRTVSMAMISQEASTPAPDSLAPQQAPEGWEQLPLEGVDV